MDTHAGMRLATASKRPSRLPSIPTRMTRATRLTKIPVRRFGSSFWRPSFGATSSPTEKPAARTTSFSSARVTREGSYTTVAFSATTDVWTSMIPSRALRAFSTWAASSAQHIPSILSWILSILLPGPGVTTPGWRRSRRSLPPPITFASATARTPVHEVPNLREDLFSCIQRWRFKPHPMPPLEGGEAADDRPDGPL